MKSEPGTAWTLVMSWSNSRRILSHFRSAVFKTDAPVNENSQNWSLYRLSLTRMTSLQSHSTHWRATCSYPIYGVDFRDYVRGTFKDFDIVNFLGTGVCKKVEYINIRGHIGIHVTVPFWASANSYFLHTDSTVTKCQLNASSGAVSSEDNFGFYGNFNTKFRCTEGSRSTTQWWFGGHLWRQSQNGWKWPRYSDEPIEEALQLKCIICRTESRAKCGVDKKCSRSV